MLSDIELILSGAISLLILVLLALMLIRGRSKESEEPRQPRGVPVNRDAGAAAVPRRGARNVRSRMRAGAARQQIEEESDEGVDEDDYAADDIALPEGKIGAKKRRKLEMKAEKKIQREREAEEREERRQRQAMLEEQRRREEEKRKAEEAKKEEEEKRLKEEKERQELEEYLKMKEAFSIEEEGYEENENEQEAQNKFQAFIDFIQSKKVVLLEDLAAHFRLKTQDCINRVQELLAQEQLVGVIDDRGKFICITREELEAVAKFIRQRGRVSISELVENSNKLISLQPENTELIAKAS